jgi:hypothetical protein
VGRVTAGKQPLMPKSSHSRDTRAARARQRATGERYTQALAATAWTPMLRDAPPGPGTTELVFMDLMIAGERAALGAPPGHLPAAVSAVRKALTPKWPLVHPEAARDVLITCAELAVGRNVASVPAEAGPDVIADAMLELTAGWVAAGRPSSRFTPPAAYASSAAFDRDDDKATFAAVCLLLALAHPASEAAYPAAGDYDGEWDEYDEYGGARSPDEDGRCFECGADPNSPYCCVDE